MKVTAVLALCLLVPVIAKRQKLLGADDTDRQQSEIQAGDAEPGAPAVLPIRELKSEVKRERADLKTLKTQMSEMKTRLKSGELSKKEKKQLRIEVNAIKDQMNTKKHKWTADVETLKTRKQEKESAPKKGRKQGRKGRKGGSKKQGLPLVADDDVPAEREEMAQLLKTGRRAGRKSRKGDPVMSDQPVVSMKKSKKGRKHARNATCSADTDCSGGAKCRTTKNGRKVCRGGMDKPSGSKCFTSEHCARGLKCFVANDAPVAAKHSKKRGVCSDPKTADLNAGALLPFRQHHKKTKTN